MKKLFLFLGVVVLAQSENDVELMDRVLGPYKMDDIFYSFGTEETKRKQTSDPDDIHFYLYNNFENWNEFHEIHWNNEKSLKSLPWIERAPVKILLHGFTQSQNTSMPSIVKNAYLESMQSGGKELNVIVVDWGSLAARPDLSAVIYPKAVRHTEIVGLRVSELIENLKNWRIVHLRDVHLIGFSLGSHVAGWAGYNVFKKNHGQRVGRISALDAAGPGFYSQLKAVNWVYKGRSLDKQDADFVDTLHTSSNSYGMSKSIPD